MGELNFGMLVMVLIYVIGQANWRGCLLAMGNVKEKITTLYLVPKNVFGIGKKIVACKEV
jgi:hypothetical protein